jgi:hypothetical protein
MAKPTIVTRATKGSALTWTEGDANFTNLQDATLTVKAGTGGTDVVSDLNGTVTLVAGTNVTLSGDNTAKTITINASGGGGGLADVVDDTTPQLGGDLDTNGNAITAVLDANVDIITTGTGVINLSHGNPEDGSLVIVGDGTNDAAIAAAGTTALNLGGAVVSVISDGDVNLETDRVVVGVGDAAAIVTTNGAYNLILNTNNGTTSPSLTLTQNGGIILQATASTNNVQVLNSVFQHVMNTSTTTSGQQFVQAHTTADANNFSLLRARGTTTSPSAVQTGDELSEFIVGGHDGQTGPTGYEPAWGFTTTVTGTPSSNVMPVRTDFVINTAANTLSTYHSISTDLVFRVAELGTISGVTDLFVSAGTNGNVEISPDGTGQVLITSAMQVGGDITAPDGSGLDLTLAGDGTGNVNLNSDTVRIGDNNTAATLTTHGTGNLILNTHNGTNSGSIVINQGANADILITPNGTGDVLLNADTVRVGDGGASANVTTDGSILVLSTNNNVSSGRITISNSLNGDITIEPNGTGDIDLVADNIQIGDANNAVTLTTFGTGNLTLSTNNGTNSGTIAITAGADGNITLAPNGSGDVQLNADTVRIGDNNTAATLTTHGTGNLTLSTNNGANTGTITINQGVNANIAITPNGTGRVVLDGMSFPAADGTTGQFLSTNGSGDLSWATVINDSTTTTTTTWSSSKIDGILGDIAAALAEIQGV